MLGLELDEVELLLECALVGWRIRPIRFIKDLGKGEFESDEEAEVTGGGRASLRGLELGGFEAGATTAAGVVVDGSRRACGGGWRYDAEKGLMESQSTAEGSSTCNQLLPIVAFSVSLFLERPSTSATPETPAEPVVEAAPDTPPPR